MTAIDTAIRRIMTIPREVLHQAFMPKRYDPTRRTRFYDNATPLSLESLIRDQLIYGRVLPDINLVSGTEVALYLKDAQTEKLDIYNSIYRFGDEATGGRTITSVFEITYGYQNSTLIGGYNGYGNYNNQQSQLLKSTRDIINATKGAPTQSTSYLQLIGHNTVLVSDVSPIQNYGLLRCMVTNDPNLNNLKPAYQIAFAKLALLATKAYVYTALVIELDEGMLRGGQQIGRFREIVDSFADADEMYMEELDNWQKLGIMNDPNQYRKVLRMSLGIKPRF